MRHPQHWYFPQFCCNMRKISAKLKCGSFLFEDTDSYLKVDLTRCQNWQILECAVSLDADLAMA